MLLIHPEILFSMPGEMEWVWILLVVVILFGGKKLPELAKGLGKGIREFKDAKDGIQREIENGMKEETNVPQEVQQPQITGRQEYKPEEKGLSNVPATQSIHK